MDHVDDEEATIELQGLHIGVVVDNLDPDAVGKVRVRIPNICEPMSAWAWPLGAFYGPGRGIHFPMAKGGDVGVLFREGDPDHPFFLPGNFGAPTGKPTEAPTPVRDLSPEEATQIAVIEFGRYLIIIDDRPGKKGLILQDKLSGDRIEHDGEKMSWMLKGTSAVIIEADGQIAIDAPLLTLNGRPVAAGEEPI
jgi:uncharacterized protein involved in type VI secretion and phage assembly